MMPVSSAVNDAYSRSCQCCMHVPLVFNDACSLSCQWCLFPQLSMLPVPSVVNDACSLSCQWCAFPQLSMMRVPSAVNDACSRSCHWCLFPQLSMMLVHSAVNAGAGVLCRRCAELLYLGWHRGQFLTFNHSVTLIKILVPNTLKTVNLFQMWINCLQNRLMPFWCGYCWLLFTYVDYRILCGQCWAIKIFYIFFVIAYRICCVGQFPAPNGLFSNGGVQLATEKFHHSS